MIWTTKTHRRARALLPTIALLAGTAGLAACDDTSDVIVPLGATAVTTFKDPTFDFTTLHTFSMPDTVVHFAPVTGTAVDVTRDFDQVALNQVRADFLARGYTEVLTPATVKPDFVVLVGVTATNNFNAFASYSWFGVWGFYPGWNWYAPGFDTSWGIVVPWFSPSNVITYDRGTLIVDLIPTVSVNPLAKTIQSEWAGVATTLLNDTVTAGTVTSAINQMFALSPYLTAVPLVATPH